MTNKQQNKQNIITLQLINETKDRYETHVERNYITFNVDKVTAILPDGECKTKIMIDNQIFVVEHQYQEIKKLIFQNAKEIKTQDLNKVILVAFPLNQKTIEAYYYNNLIQEIFKNVEVNYNIREGVKQKVIINHNDIKTKTYHEYNLIIAYAVIPINEDDQQHIDNNSTVEPIKLLIQSPYNLDNKTIKVNSFVNTICDYKHVDKTIRDNSYKIELKELK